MYNPADFIPRCCVAHQQEFVVRHAGFAKGRQQYAQICPSCEYERYKARTDFNEHARQHRARHRDHHLARKAVDNALARGKLVRQPCEHCGTTEKVQAHHEDYADRLKVRWLCRPCHAEHHRKVNRS